MENTVKPYKFLNRDVIKYIAIVTMLMDHLADVFGEQLLTQAPTLYYIFTKVGTFTAITMVYFLVEGYHYTHSKRNYISRLFLFAAISQIPFMLAFTEEGIIAFDNLNMLFTLCVCFGVLYVIEKGPNIIVKVCLIALAIYITRFFDWPYLAVIFTILFAWAGKSKKRTIIAFLLALVCTASFYFYPYLQYFSMASEQHISLSDIGLSAGVLAQQVFNPMIGMFAAAICMIFFYNGKRMETGKVGRAFSKWFFYIFYPGHLLILGIIRIVFCS